MASSSRIRSLRGQPALRVTTAAIGLALVNGAPRSAAAQTTAEAPLQLPAIAVQGNQGTTATSGYQVTTPALSKLTEPLRDTPQSVISVPRQLIEDQNNTSVRDALRNVPGISLSAGEGGSQGDNLTLRGFSTRNDIFIDGMRDFGSYTRDPFYLEQIEVLKGPAGILFGRGSTGGVINQVSKQAGQTAITNGSVTLGTDGTRRITTDINRAIPGLEGAAVRLNTVGYDAGVADRNQARNSRLGVAPTVTFGQGTANRLTLSYLHQQEYDIPDYGLPWIASLSAPARVNRSNFYGFADNDFLRTDVDVVTARYEHDFSDSVTFRNQFRYGSYRREARITEPQVTQAVTGATPLSSINVVRNEITTRSEETFLQNQSDVTSRFRTGVLDHTLVTGFEVGRETSDPTRRSYANSGVATTSLLAPNPFQAFTTVPPYISSRTNVIADTLGVYALDTVKLGEHWQLVGGVRYDRFAARYRATSSTSATSAITPLNLQRTDEQFSYRAALVYKPIQAASVYFSYGTSFNPSAEALALAANTASLAPEKNRTFEVGAKYDVLDQRLSLSTALFRVEKTNAKQTDPNNSLLMVLAGNAKSDGIEFAATGHLTDRWEVFGGYTYQDARLTESPIAANVGRQLQNAPHDTFSLYSTYVLPWHDVKLGLGGNYVSRRAASATPDAATGLVRTLPGYFTMQASAAYKITPNVELQANVYNVTDRYYYDLPHPNHVIPGAGRAALFSVNVKL